MTQSKPTGFSSWLHRSSIVGRRIILQTRDRNVTFLAAGVAYYAFISVIPALLLALVIATTIGGELLVERILGVTGEFLTPAGETAVTGAIRDAPGRTEATLIGILVLFWGALRVFRGLDHAFSDIYGLDRNPSFLEGLRDATVVLSTVGLGIGTMFLVGALLAASNLRVGQGLLGLTLLLGGLVVVFLPLYVVFSDPETGVKKALPGAMAAAAGWVILQALFQLYTAAAPRYQLYGVVGGILILVTWFYVAAIALLLGAVINVVLTNKNRHSQGTPTRAN